MDAQAGANTPGWLHHPATRLEQASTDVLEKMMTDPKATEALLRQADEYLSGDQHRPTRMVRKLRDALASAEAAIRDAPHESWCASNDWGDDNEPADARPCDCWKSESTA